MLISRYPRCNIIGNRSIIALCVSVTLQGFTADLLGHRHRPVSSFYCTAGNELSRPDNMQILSILTSSLGIFLSLFKFTSRELQFLKSSPPLKMSSRSQLIAQKRPTRYRVCNEDARSRERWGVNTNALLLRPSKRRSERNYY